MAEPVKEVYIVCCPLGVKLSIERKIQRMRIIQRSRNPSQVGLTLRILLLKIIAENIAKVNTNAAKAAETAKAAGAAAVLGSVVGVNTGKAVLVVEFTRGLYSKGTN